MFINMKNRCIKVVNYWMIMVQLSFYVLSKTPLLKSYDLKQCPSFVKKSPKISFKFIKRIIIQIINIKNKDIKVNIYHRF